jgi:PAS domain S-box-containing protein
MSNFIILPRERNREHAKRSRVRKKFLLESLQQSVVALQDENEILKAAIRTHLKDEAEVLLTSCNLGDDGIIASDPSMATRRLDDPDYSLLKALQSSQQNFVITDPSLPDNPIVYASHGFLQLTGYSLDQVLGRNCRFLQGPETDPNAVDKIRQGIVRGEDTTVVLLNYRRDGSIFWNQFFVAALRDSEGNAVNYLGVQCKVDDEYAEAAIKSADENFKA